MATVTECKSFGNSEKNKNIYNIMSKNLNGLLIISMVTVSSMSTDRQTDRHDIPDISEGKVIVVH